MASKESILQVHRLKLHLQDRAAKTVNNVLTVLSLLLKAAVEWDVIDQLPCSIRLLPVTRREAAFHDFDAYERLLEASMAIDWRTYLIALLGGEGGLRVGEIVALEWVDIDLERRQINVRHSDWRGQLTTPKNGRGRLVAMTDWRRVKAAIGSPSTRQVAGRQGFPETTLRPFAKFCPVLLIPADSAVGRGHVLGRLRPLTGVCGFCGCDVTRRVTRWEQFASFLP